MTRRIRMMTNRGRRRSWRTRHTPSRTPKKKNRSRHSYHSYHNFRNYCWCLQVRICYNQMMKMEAMKAVEKKKKKNKKSFVSALVSVKKKVDA